MACPTVLLKKVEASSTIDDSEEEEERPKRIRACIPSQEKKNLPTTNHTGAAVEGKQIETAYKGEGTS